MTIRQMPLAALAVAVAVALTSAAPAEASDAPRGRIGLGVIVGEPTGLSLKVRNSGASAVDAAVAWSADDDVDLHLHADYLRHRYDTIQVDRRSIPFYYGIGGRILLREGDRDSRVGLRIPVGIEWIFADGGLSTFFELAPILDLAPDTEFDLNAAVGLRWIFGSGSGAAGR